MLKHFLFLSLFISLNSFSQENISETLIKHSFEEVTLLQSKEKRPVIVFLHTDWCKYCFAMKKNTFNNKDILKILNERFYFISFNAESKKDVSFNNHLFKYKPNGNTGVHEIAVALTSNKLTYPSTIILSSENEILFEASTFLNSKNLLNILMKTISK